MKNTSKAIIMSGLLLTFAMTTTAQAQPELKPTASITCSTIANGRLNYKQLIKATHWGGASGQGYQNTQLKVTNGTTPIWNTTNTLGNVNQAIALTPSANYTFSFLDASGALLATLQAVAPNCSTAVRKEMIKIQPIQAF